MSHSAFRASTDGTIKRQGRRRGLIACAAALALVPGAALAASPPLPGEVVPRQIPYRGYLDQNGVPVTNSSVAMVFELFGSENGIDRLWSEPQAISVLDGNFTAALGDVNPIPASAFQQPVLFLQISVDGQQLAGRQRLLTVPYSHAAHSASNVRGRDITTLLVPAGSVMAFAGPAVPAGWLLCDGRELRQADYPGLFAAIGTAWGGGSGTFRLPDLRGQFLRGADAGANIDPGPRVNASNQPASGVGTYEAQATAVNGVQVGTAGAHVHGDGSLHALRVTGTFTETGTDSSANQPDLRNAHAIPSAGDHTHALSGDAETRPVNAAVNWIIKQ